MRFLESIIGLHNPHYGACINYTTLEVKGMTLWHHSRQGKIRGEIIYEDGDWVDIELSAPARVTWGRSFNFMGHGRSDSHAAAGEVIRVRKSLLTEITE